MPSLRKYRRSEHYHRCLWPTHLRTGLGTLLKILTRHCDTYGRNVGYSVDNKRKQLGTYTPPQAVSPDLTASRGNTSPVPTSSLNPPISMRPSSRGLTNPTATSSVTESLGNELGDNRYDYLSIAVGTLHVGLCPLTLVAFYRHRCYATRVLCDAITGF